MIWRPNIILVLFVDFSLRLVHLSTRKYTYEKYNLRYSMLDSSFFPDKKNRIAEWARLAFTLSLGYDIDSETSEYIMSIEIRQHTFTFTLILW